MKFIHIADVHLGAKPDVGSEYGEKRSQELWKTFENVLALCEKDQTDLLLIAGDLFHRQPLLRELKEVDYLFSTLTHTKVVLIAGNHDYLAKNSYYRTFTWSDNVYPLLGTVLESVYFEEFDTAVYGFSYDRREIFEPRYDQVRAEGKASCEILLAHGGDEKHIPIRRAALERSGFDYIALGHIHKPSQVIEQKAMYAGALEPIDQNDVGPHGLIQGEISEGSVRTRFVPCAKREYMHVDLSMEKNTTLGEVRAQMRQMIETYGKENFYRFSLKGYRDADLDIDPTQLLVAGNVLKVVDETKVALDLERLRVEHGDDLIGRYMGLFDGCVPGSVEEQALYEGVQALLGQNGTKRG